MHGFSKCQIGLVQCDPHGISIVLAVYRYQMVNFALISVLAAHVQPKNQLSASRQ
jgi:hypothetical protein